MWTDWVLTLPHPVICKVCNPKLLNAVNIGFLDMYTALQGLVFISTEKNLLGIVFLAVNEGVIREKNTDLYVPSVSPHVEASDHSWEFKPAIILLLVA